MMNKLVEDKIPQLRQKCKELGVRRLSVFGSVVNNTFKSGSDIDFLLAFNEQLSIEEYTNNYFLLHDFLQQLFNREVDVITENSLSNPFFIERINQQKQIVYEA